MIYISVKEYAALIGKSDKSVYKMIDKGRLIAKKEEKVYLVAVDRQFVKLVKALRSEIETLNAERAATAPKAKSAVKKSRAKPLKKTAAKTLKKGVAKKSPLKPTTKKRVKKVSQKKSTAPKTAAKKKK